MKAVLDHVGIAVQDVPAALAFYRDALGLEVEPPEEVMSQHVRAHFIPAGPAALELLEATAPGSAVAKFLDRRGPGLHHITLRVEHLSAALEQLRARGVRLIDEHPRPGADQSVVAFIHPSSAHGVLVELKESRPRHREARISRYQLGRLELVSLYDGTFRLDGGAMFGVVPRVLWEKKAPPDARHRITLGMRPLLVRGDRTLLIDAGLGDKDDDKFRDIYGVERSRHLHHALAEAGVSTSDVDIVLATHLHFDHAGGFTTRDAAGRLRPRFPNARYLVRRGEWDDATHPHSRNRASYLPDNFVPLAEAGALDLIEADQEVMPGVRVQRTGGHTAHHQMVWIESDGARAAYMADMMPTTAHLPDAWVMGYDLFPMDTLAAKQAFVSDVLARETLLYFEHDPAVAAGHLLDTNGKRSLRPTP
jgi:methylmalonyl-CoA epimerase